MAAVAGGPRVALVTGAAQGLGAAIARRLHADGARVAIADVNEQGALALASELDPGAGSAVAIGVDVRSRDAVQGALDEAERALGSLDIVVNNAALTVSRPVFEIEPGEWDDVLAVNLRGVLFGCQLAGPRLRGRGWGRIVNMASMAGQQGGTVAGAHYAASKAGILVLTKIVAKELAGSGVTCNAVAPAAIRGPAMETMDPARIAALEEQIPAGRFGEPDEVAALVAFLCSEHAGYITGAAYDINGGLAMR